MSKPRIMIDLDGVIVEFFEEYAKLAGVISGNYRDIPIEKAEPTLDKMIGTDFFATLQKTHIADDLIKLIVDLHGTYSICSSPLRGDHANSEKWKRVWIKNNLNPLPDEIMITPNKATYAIQTCGTPNILIDDRGLNITNWINAGGIGIKFQASEDSLQTVIDGLPA